MTEDIRGLVRELGTKFIQRKDVKAFQRNDGAWFPDRTPMTMQDFRSHLDGTATMGHYLLDQNNNAKLFAFDIDLTKHGQECPGTGCKGCPTTFTELIIGEDGNPHKAGGKYTIIARDGLTPDHPAYTTLVINLRCMAEGLARQIHRKLQVPVGIAFSGNKGLHVYAFTGEMPAEVQKELALNLLDTGVFKATRGDNFWKHTYAYEMLEIEVFPKQTNLDGKDLGNLMSLPLGIHQVTKTPKFFVDCRSTVDRLIPKDPLLVLEGDLPWE